MKAVILVAGSGTRLRPYTDELPKTLVPVAGRPMLDHILEALAGFDIDETVLVTGYKSAEIERFAQGRQGLRLIHNDRYDTLNNFYSLLVALDYLEGHDFLKIDGDLVFEPRLVDLMLSSQGAVRIATDTSKELGEEEMKIEVDDSGRLVRFSKEIPPERAFGESIGMEFVAAGAIEPLRRALERLFEEGRYDAYYEEAYGILGSEGFDVRAVAVPEDLRWIEVDDHDDLRQAEELFGGSR